ncbi:MAG TPA: SDR family NAD(P)-dependent oxidoreductase, partial [Alphaproteobacteria bacterium]|nr:SDR family NAD(P)-dependent oxidoreductase [Alphaproteobacteria bacterium]
MSATRRRVAMVTGAAGVMGKAAARFLIEDGFRLALADLDRTRLDAAARELGEGSLAVAFDVSDFKAAEAACGHIADALGPVDVLVNNAGILSNHKAADTTPEEWHRVLGANLDGAFYLSKLLLPGMKERRWGRIVNTCSLAMKSGGLTAGTAYTTSKGALAALTFS